MTTATTTESGQVAKRRKKKGNGRLSNRRTSAQKLLNIALFTTFLGLALLTYLISNRSRLISEGQTVQVGNLSLQIKEIDWLAHEHGGHDHDDGEAVDPQQEEIEELTAEGQVFPMPSSMMPGMPEAGQLRLQIEFSLQNEGNRPLPYGPEAFSLHSENGGFWFPQTTNAFRAGDLGMGQTINGVFTFDVADTATELYMLWQRDGDEIRIPIENPDTH